MVLHCCLLGCPPSSKHRSRKRACQALSETCLIVRKLAQLAKLWTLEFYYDILDRYFDRRDFELIQMDTDSNYMAVSGRL